jgi:hypothetical protein
MDLSATGETERLFLSKHFFGQFEDASLCVCERETLTFQLAEIIVELLQLELGGCLTAMEVAAQPNADIPRIRDFKAQKLFAGYFRHVDSRLRMRRYGAGTGGA